MIGKHCTLVGMPGSGKSTVGRQLSRRLGLPFFDSDAVIEARLGGSIRDFFAEQGEDAFRDLEESVLAELLEGAPSVIATGGGAVLRQINRSRMRAASTVFYLRTTPGSLHRRLRNDTKRPLLQVDDPLQRLRDLYAVRDPLYREAAHFILDARGSSVALLVHNIQMQLELSQRNRRMPRGRPRTNPPGD